jgi:hypothetical protein
MTSNHFWWTVAIIYSFPAILLEDWRFGALSLGAVCFAVLVVSVEKKMK